MINIVNFTASHQGHVIFDHASISIPSGNLCGISGQSGSGKTTLLYLLGLISSFQSCEYYYDDTNISLLDENIKSEIRKQKIGFVFQDKNLHEYLTIEENMKLYALISGKKYSTKRSLELLDLVHLDLPLNQLCRNLSGGEKQRLAIACAIYKDPDLLICDEVTSALDKKNRDLILDLLNQIAKDHKMVVITSHDQAVLDQCDLKYIIKNHKIIGEEVNQNSNRFEIVHKRLSHQFFKWYAAFDFGMKKFEKALITILPILLLVSSIILSSLRIGLVNSYQAKVDCLGTNEVLVQYKNGISKEAIKYLNTIQGVKDIYPMNENKIYYKDQLVLIVPYYYEQILPNQIEKSFDNGDVYVSYDLYDGNSEIFIEGQIYKIKGVLKEDLNLIQGNNICTIYIPFEFQNHDRYNLIVIKMESFEALEGVSDRIHQYQSNYQVSLSQDIYRNQIVLFDQYKEILNQYIIIVGLVVMILLAVIQVLSIMSQKYEIAILKANGLSKKELIMLMFYVLLRKLKKIGCYSCLIIFVIGLACFILQFPINLFSFEIFQLIILLFFFVFVIPTLMMTIYISSINCEKLLRF